MVANETGLKHRPSGGKGMGGGGRKLPLSPNPLEGTMKRRMKIERR
jgi:hypothetical protein